MSALETKQHNKQSIRIAQINILNNEEGEEYRYEFLAHYLKKIGADIITLQEVRNKELLVDKLSSIGYTNSVFGAEADGGLPDPDGVSIFSKKDLPIVSSEEYEFKIPQINLRRGLLAEFNIDNLPFYVYTAHFAWNMQNEYVRLWQAQKIGDLAKQLTGDDPNTVGGGRKGTFVLSGDLNTSEQSRTYRYLTGLHPVMSCDSKGKVMLNSVTSSDGCFFIDAYEMNGRDLHTDTSADNISVTGNWDTTDQGHNYWGRKTAQRHGIDDPRFIPKRRIDYILSYGWNYGKRGCPLNYHRFGDPEPESGFEYDLSDHYGIYSDILL